MMQSLPLILSAIAVVAAAVSAVLAGRAAGAARQGRIEVLEGVLSLAEEIKGLPRSEFDYSVIRKLEGRVHTAESSFEDLRSGLRKFEEEFAEVSNKLAALAGTANSTSADLGEIRRSIEQTDRELREALGRNHALEAECRSLRDAVEQSRTQSERLQEEKEVLAKQIGEVHVEPSLTAIEATLQEAAILGGGAEEYEMSNAAEAIRKEGGRIIAALEAAQRGEPEPVAALVEASAFDPYSFPEWTWPRLVPAKRVLEAVRAAAREAVQPLGFTVVQPRVRVDSYDSDLHDSRDEIGTAQLNLAGKIAEVRRAGLLHGTRLVRPARVVRYVIDHTATFAVDAPVEPLTEPAAPEDLQVPFVPSEAAPVEAAEEPPPVTVSEEAPSMESLSSFQRLEADDASELPQTTAPSGPSLADSLATSGSETPETEEERKRRLTG